MATNKIGKQIDDLINAERWEEARKLIQEALKKEPDSHWLLTQLGETYYEERQYKQALQMLLQSQEILPDCPLTLWHLAGTLDALGRHATAIRLYGWLLRSKRTPKDDPCWESTAWTDLLKTDCVYRIGLCFRHLKQNEPAEKLLRAYCNILLAGGDGSYPIEEARKQLQELRTSKRAAVKHELREAADLVRKESGEEPTPATDPPTVDRQSLLELQEA